VLLVPSPPNSSSPRQGFPELFMQRVPGSGFSWDTAAGFLFCPCKATAGTSPGSEEPRAEAAVGFPGCSAVDGVFALPFLPGPTESLH